MKDERIQIQKTEFIPKELEPLRELSLSGSKFAVLASPNNEYVDYIKNVNSKIREVMENYFEVKTLSDEVKPQKSNFQTLLQLLNDKNCILGIAILDGLRPNVVLEYGILLALDKPLIVLKDENAEIDVKNLDVALKSKFDKYHISNPKLDIDKHLSNVKDLHWASYDWRHPDKLKEILEEELLKLKNDILSEVKNTLTTPEINNLGESNYKEFQQSFSEMAGYIVRFIKPDYQKIKEFDKNMHLLAKKSNIKLPSNYYFELGNIYYELSRFKEAEISYNKAIEINPNLAEAHYNLGILLTDLKRYDEAEKEYREAIRINPNDAEAHYNLGILLTDLKRYTKAEKEYREAIRINPDYAKAHNNLGVLLKNLQRYEEAEKEYREAIRINPNYAEAHNNLGVLLTNLQRYEEAEKEYREAIRINPDYAGIYYNLGCLYSIKNDLKNAVEWLKKGD